jgi:LmbE family N-acetylglucosaminyl deacetylase
MKIKSLDDIQSLGTILGVWAHPDDESFTCGGLLAAAVRSGQRVVCVTATKGEAGVQDAKRWPPYQLGEIRAAELQDALKILGIKEHYWLGYQDGLCNLVEEAEAVGKIQRIVQTARPDTILTFGPDGLTGHPDHQTVSKWANKVAQSADWPINIYHVVTLRDLYDNYLKPADEALNIYFMIDEPVLKQAEECDIYFSPTSDLMDIKRRALAAMPSQMETTLKYFDKPTFDKAFAHETFIKASK